MSALTDFSADQLLKSFFINLFPKPLWVKVIRLGLYIPQWFVVVDYGDGPHGWIWFNIESDAELAAEEIRKGYIPTGLTLT
jgi:hypothetical protein